LLRSLIVLLALLHSAAVHAASARFSRLSVEDGLSQSSVESIAEDRYGFLWLGTQEGLNRFDGYQFTVHRANNLPGQLRDDFIRAIAPDARGDLWIGTETGVQHLDAASGRFGESVTPPGLGVRLNTLLVSRSDGRLWFGGLNGGLWTWHPQAPTRRVATRVIGPGDLVTAATFGASPGTLWVASRDRLILVSANGDAGAATARVVLSGVGFIRVIHAAADGALWLGRQGRPMLRFDPREGTTVEHPHLPQYVITLVPAGEGRLWIGGKDAGLTRFDPKSGEVLTYRHEPGNEESLAENDVAIVHQDRGGSLWVGAWNGGLSRLNLYAQAFRTLRHDPGQPQSLPDNDVTRMAEGGDGRLWTISRNDVLSVGNPLSGAFATLPLRRQFTAIAFAGPELFVGTNTGLLQLDPGDGSVRPAPPSIRNAGLDRAPVAALLGSDEALWIVAGGMLHRLAAESQRALQSLRLPFADPVSLFAPSPERLWILYSEGVLLRVERSARGELTLHRTGDASLLSRGRLIAVTEHRGVVWIGAARGIGKLRPDGRTNWMDLERGMPSRSVASILADDSGVLWIPTNQGITRYDVASGRAVHLGGVQGAQASGYVDGGGIRGPSGLLYFAGRGITVFDPRLVVENPHRPRVLFTALEILHRPVLPAWMDPDSPLRTGIHATEEVALGPEVVVFSVEMAAPGVSDPDRVRFAHRLEGFDRRWIETTADRRVATYTRLAPGEYVLRARAQTQSGLWSGDEATLRIRILPPWWRTPAAIGVWCVLLGLALVVAFLETRRRTRVRIALAEQEALRRASVTDPLTGLYNRRFLNAWLEHEVPRTLRTHRDTSPDRRPEFLHIVMADLDNLKDINDAWGHDAGDRAIRAVADLLESQARAGDVAIRWGGDEFLLVLRSSDRAHAPDIVERLRASAERLDVPHAEAPASTISLGFATFPFLAREPEALTWEETMQLADRALLRSKRRRRNGWTGYLPVDGATAARLLAELREGSEWPSQSVRVVDGP
jgi:diguanylate cyclase (GGDEF)-like protein